MSNNFDNIPLELRHRKQWVCWQLVTRDGKPTKLPINANTGKLASSTNPDTWSTFDQAVKSMPSFSGIGFVFSPDDGLFGIDLDGHIDRDIIDWFGTYAERSQSGTGCHIIGRGKLSRRGGKVTTGDHQGVEIYSVARYFVVTGDVIGHFPITDCQAKLDEFVASVLPPERTTSLASFLPTNTTESDADLLDRIRQSDQGIKFDALFAGNFEAYHNSQSEADAALLSILRFWTGGDQARSFAIFRSSGLMRAKAERKDYLLRTWARIDAGDVLDPLPEALPAPAMLSGKPLPKIVTEMNASPWRKVSIESVRQAISGTILQPMTEAICSPTDPPLPLEVGLVKALALAGCALSGKRDKPRGLGDFITKGHHHARVRIMTAGGQVPNFFCLLVGESASGKDIGNLVADAALQFKWLIGSSGSEEGLADAYIAKPNGLLTVSELQNWLDARHWQHKASSFITSAYNQGWFQCNLSKRGEAPSRETDYCYPNIIANVQPGILEFNASKASSDSGFIGRFLVAEMPIDFLAYPRCGDLATERKRLVDCLKVLNSKEGDVTPPDRYQERLNELFASHKAEPRPTWKRLANEYYPRLALLLSIPIGDNTRQVQITQDGWDRAFVVCQFFFREAERVFGKLHFDPSVAKFEKLCERILSIVKAKGKISRGDIAPMTSRGIRQKDRNDAIAELVFRKKITIEKEGRGEVLVATDEG